MFVCFFYLSLSLSAVFVVCPTIRILLEALIECMREFRFCIYTAPFLGSRAHQYIHIWNARQSKIISGKRGNEFYGRKGIDHSTDADINVALDKPMLLRASVLYIGYVFCLSSCCIIEREVARCPLGMKKLANIVRNFQTLKYFLLSSRYTQYIAVIGEKKCLPPSGHAVEFLY